MAHIHEKIDFTVEVFIVYQNRVLLRMHDKYKFWCSVGGHIELDEDPLEAAYREVKEEVGLEVEIVSTKQIAPKSENYRPLIPPEGIYRHFIDDTHEHVCFVYFAKAETDKIVDSVLEHEKGADIKWASKEDILSMDLRPDIRFYALQALEVVTCEK